MHAAEVARVHLDQAKSSKRWRSQTASDSSGGQDTALCGQKDSQIVNHKVCGFRSEDLLSLLEQTLKSNRKWHHSKRMESRVMVLFAKFIIFRANKRLFGLTHTENRNGQKEFVIQTTHLVCTGKGRESVLASKDRFRPVTATGMMLRSGGFFDSNNLELKRLPADFHSPRETVGASTLSSREMVRHVCAENGTLFVFPDINVCPNIPSRHTGRPGHSVESAERQERPAQCTLCCGWSVRSPVYAAMLCILGYQDRWRTVIRELLDCEA